MRRGPVALHKFRRGFDLVILKDVDASVGR
jgi:hypothetical protein